MKILLPVVLIALIILAFFIVDACRITPRLYHNGSTALVLTVYDLPVFVYVANDPTAFVVAHRNRGYTPIHWSTIQAMQPE